MALQVTDTHYAAARTLIEHSDVAAVATALARAELPRSTVKARLSPQAMVFGLAGLVLVLGTAVVLTFIGMGDFRDAMDILKGAGGAAGILLFWAWMFLG